MKNKTKKLWIYILSIILILIDQTSKLLIINNLKNLPFKVINKVLYFNYYENTGVAFSFAEGNVAMFVILNFILITGLIFFYEKNKKNFKNITKIFIACIIAGGISNLIDRMLKGHVVDFIDVSNLIHFPVFNIADIFIVIGTFGFAICYLISELRNNNIK